MEILDKHFIGLSYKRKWFILMISLAYLIIGLIAYLCGLTNIVETLLIFVIGILYSEIIKLHYRIESLETKNHKVK